MHTNLCQMRSNTCACQRGGNGSNILAHVHGTKERHVKRVPVWLPVDFILIKMKCCGISAGETFSSTDMTHLIKKQLVQSHVGVGIMQKSHALKFLISQPRDPREHWTTTTTNSNNHVHCHGYQLISDDAKSTMNFVAISLNSNFFNLG